MSIEGKASVLAALVLGLLMCFQALLIYEGLQWYAAQQYARSRQDDADVQEVERVSQEKSAYLRWGRDTLGWAIYVFRQGATRGASSAV